MFTPAIAAEIVLGRWLTHVVPRPGFLAVLCVAPGMIALLIFGMLVGGIIWLVVMKPFVKRDVLAELFLGGPRVPVFSALCNRARNPIRIYPRMMRICASGVRVHSRDSRAFVSLQTITLIQVG
jgi:hypothetical protein